ncbi:hypothetical protein GGQ13_003028 [Salinibacter ruber]|uniref:hypothetical protein n=1 Tax=Salinibacter ruber TaxID=146919 RepID=UPI0021678022|nr:hypothetical protein [Salinibacter ruber]MCS4139573.1 hypothetical protein [Salinibacter ruber]
MQDKDLTGWALSRRFLRELRRRQDLIHKESDKGASAWWLLLPLWLLGASAYAACDIVSYLIWLVL